MQLLDHERLDVYHLALDFLVFANGVRAGKEMVVRIVSMLIRLAQACEQ